ncbi:MAG: mandelate racemase/muconate lactonizing enzyme family protein [Terriglobia bacterium]
MERRSFLKAAGIGGPVALAAEGRAESAAKPPEAPKMKITRIRFYLNPLSSPTFNQSANIVTVETDQGITGVGEGGSPDMLRQCAAMIIGENPFHTDRLWQVMFRGYFYPAGREKLDALGAIDLALWDIKGKALGVPVHELLGGQAREHVECYSTDYPVSGSLREAARACMEEGYRSFRTAIADPPRGQPFNSHVMVRKTYENCKEIRAGVGANGDWSVDYHTRLDFGDAVRLSTLIENLEPYFAEDLVRSEDPGVYKQLRAHVKVPIAVGEQFGAKWDVRWLVEQQLIDYSRVTLPNCGGLTEYMKIAALCETHYAGLIPHFTGPVSEAALVHALSVFSGPVMMEVFHGGLREYPHLPQSFDFRQGKMWPNKRPGLGVALDTKPLRLAFEVTEPYRPIPMLYRPDGSYTNW